MSLSKQSKWAFSSDDTKPYLTFSLSVSLLHTHTHTHTHTHSRSLAQRLQTVLSSNSPQAKKVRVESGSIFFHCIQAGAWCRTSPPGPDTTAMPLRANTFSNLLTIKFNGIHLLRQLCRAQKDSGKF
jgi:hypothetical protein